MRKRTYFGLVVVVVVIAIIGLSLRWIVGSSGAVMTASIEPVVAEGSKERCSALQGAKLGAATVDTVETIERGKALFGIAQRLLIKLVWHGFPGLDAPVEFCRATAKLVSIPGSSVNIEAWLPQQWNGKLVAIGGGGFNGGMGASAPMMMASPLSKGYVVFVTDAGHKETESAKFAYDSPEQFTDFAWRANHVSAAFAKELATKYYEEPVKRSYFDGCSNGGRDAVMEARRFPEDYDGILAGAPAVSWSRLMSSFAWNAQAIHDAGGVSGLSKKLQIVQDAVIKKCDALDGVRDGFIENPTNCPFDPAELQCKAGDSANCLNADEVAVLRKIYAGPQMRDGTRVFPGLSVGGEATSGNWDLWLLSGKKAVQKKLGVESFRWMVYGDPEWDIRQFDLDRDYPVARERFRSVDADDPDLSAFTGRGGKLLLWHGWSDAAISPRSTIDYYASVRNTVGSAADSQVRLFMVPGMLHCFGGVGANTFDRLDAMDHWVESGAAPERIVATEYDPPSLFPVSSAKVVRTRPLCAWPKQAHYSGSGSTDDASNFRCE